MLWLYAALLKKLKTINNRLDMMHKLCLAIISAAATNY